MAIGTDFSATIWRFVVRARPRMFLGSSELEANSGMMKIPRVYRNKISCSGTSHTIPIWPHWARPNGWSPALPCAFNGSAMLHETGQSLATRVGGQTYCCKRFFVGAPSIQRFIDFSRPGRQLHRIQTNQASRSPRNSLSETQFPGSEPASPLVWVTLMEPVPIVRLELSMLAANFFRRVAESRSLFAG
jgi:hypothetical protein